MSFIFYYIICLLTPCIAHMISYFQDNLFMRFICEFNNYCLPLCRENGLFNAKDLKEFMLDEFESFEKYIECTGKNRLWRKSENFINLSFIKYPKPVILLDCLLGVIICFYGLVLSCVVGFKFIPIKIYNNPNISMLIFFSIISMTLSKIF